MENPMDNAVRVIHARSIALKVVNKLLDGIDKIQTPEEVEDLLVKYTTEATTELSKEIRHQFTKACEAMEIVADEKLEQIVRRNMGDTD